MRWIDLGINKVPQDCQKVILGILFWIVQIKWKMPKFLQTYEEGLIALVRFTRIDYNEDSCPD